jgi:hypothetical protein
MFIPLAPSQTTEKFGAFGIGYNSPGADQIVGWGVIAIPVAETTYSFSGYDVSILPGTPFSKLLQANVISYSVHTGIAQKVYSFTSGCNLYGLAQAGISTGQSGSILGNFIGGGFLDIAIKKGWGVIAAIEVNRNSDNGTQVIPRIGLRKKL